MPTTRLSLTATPGRNYVTPWVAKAEATGVTPPLRVAAQQVYRSGVVAAQVFRPGVVAAQVR
jgi:hypothetical protein